MQTPSNELDSSRSEPARLARIAIVGGESTGKSTLVTDLAQALDTEFAAEFAREYLTPKDGQYTLPESLTIIEGQLKWEDEAATRANDANKPLIICDTEAISTMLWAEWNFGESLPQVHELIKDRHYDLFVLCSPTDMAWDDDGLRKSPTSREWFTKQFIEQLSSRNRPYIQVQGTREERVKQVVDMLRERNLIND